ncbi:MAG: DNA polymerase IV [Ornithinimicrobium sp.]|uniref:DNA polymerase IV n=1 Tax=Ornithinimicrobium sp. TaxID=1977084 RepID=UPI003D9B75C0
MPWDAPKASILHLDLDAFFAAVEQRDKPSLRGKAVVVGGLGGRGVVSTASYEARRYGARSAMPTAEARRRCPPGTAFLAGRYEAYRVSSGVVMDVLREVSPRVEQVSVDEAYVDLAAGEVDLCTDGLRTVGERVMAEIRSATGGLTASVGIGTSKMMAKIGSEMGKPAGLTLIAPGEELDVLHPMPVRAVAGVGPATAGKLRGFGVETVGDLARIELTDLVSIFGTAHGQALHDLAKARDARAVQVERIAKSVSAEETFETDITDRAVLHTEIDGLTARVAARLGTSATFARTITVKARWHDFTTVTRSGSLPHATGEPAVIAREARRLLDTVDVASGLRLLGVGVSGLTTHAQDELVLDAEAVEPQTEHGADSAPDVRAQPTTGPAPRPQWRTGHDVRHAEHGAGWVWGAGRGVVTVRFEGPLTGPGPIRSFPLSDPALQPADPPDWRQQGPGA